jgi:hypothetical protein
MPTASVFALPARRAAVPLAVQLALFAREVVACPMCASQQPGGALRIVALGLMLLVPFVVVGIVFRTLRRARR